MSSSEDFDYDAALTKLIELRFQARVAGQEKTAEIQQLEAELYALLDAPTSILLPTSTPSSTRTVQSRLTRASD